MIVFGYGVIAQKSIELRDLLLQLSECHDAAFFRPLRAWGTPRLECLVSLMAKDSHTWITLKLSVMWLSQTPIKAVRLQIILCPFSYLPKGGLRDTIKKAKMFVALLTSRSVCTLENMLNRDRPMETT
jgi:hypothetical protein